LGLNEQQENIMVMQTGTVLTVISITNESRLLRG